MEDVSAAMVDISSFFIPLDTKLKKSITIFQKYLDAVEQIKHYAEAPRVEALRQGTTLHKIIMQFKGWELERMEEV